VGTFATVFGLDAFSFSLDRVTDVSSAECCWVAVGFWVFICGITAFVNWYLGCWSILADFWIFINTVWAIFVSVAVDLAVQ
jgi:hypothetical protein